jgi:peptidoglycan/xylan/chitin deacetylase (PgdA/CDA1 family)
MPKKINGALFILFLVFVLGISGCGGERPSTKMQEEAPLTTINPSNELKLDESSNNLSKPSNVQEIQAVPILYYHSVMHEAGNELKIPPEQFEAQMAYLQDNGYQSVSLEQLYRATYQGGILPENPFVITFDDGYVDNYTTAFPIVTKYGFTAAIFMITDYINGEGFLSWEQLKELVANGWEIESHTTNHPYLTKVNTSTVLSELHSSKELLEKELGRPVSFFAYPYGDFNTKVVQAVKDTDYLMAVSTKRGWAEVKADAWQVQRIYCYASMGMNEFSRRMKNPNY